MCFLSCSQCNAESNCKWDRFTSSCKKSVSSRGKECPAPTMPTCAGILQRRTKELEFNSQVYDLSLQTLYLSDLVYTEYAWPLLEGEKYYFPYAAYKKYEFTIRKSYESKNKLDQALVAQSNGRCFGIFRGTIPFGDNQNHWGTILSDWVTNVLPVGTETICGGCGCCEGRISFIEILQNEFWEFFQIELKTCAQEYCTDPSDCIVLGGHSQGGAVAEVAAHVLADFDPWIFTFGRPNSMKNPCPHLSSLRQYNFCNTDTYLFFGIKHDPVFFVPAGLENAYGSAKAGKFGYNIFLSNEKTVATKSDLSRDLFNPKDDLIGALVAAPVHSIGTLFGSRSYFEHLDRLYDANAPETTFPIPSNGWIDSGCLFDEQCLSKQCVYYDGPKPWFGTANALPCSSSNNTVYTSICSCKPPG